MQLSNRFYYVLLPLPIFLLVILIVGQVRANERAIDFKDETGAGINGQVRVLCFPDAAATTVLSDQMFDIVNGNLASGQFLPNNCSHLAAMKLEHTQPSAYDGHGPAYWIYTTSWQPGDTMAQADGTIQIDSDNALTLFNVVASLGWEPAADSSVLRPDDLQSALEATSAEIYDWTEGRALFGNIDIYTNGENWRSADMRFLPNNDQRPGAFVGGIVEDNLTYLTADGSATTYVPGMTIFGREWAGNFNTVTGTRTIAHEWMHYAFFLYDEYVQSDGHSHYCVCDDLDEVGASATAACAGQTSDLVGSAMAFHYTATELWHPDTHTEVGAFCYDTMQYDVHGESDWDTLENWGNIQGLSLGFNPFPKPAAIVSGPNLGLSRHLVDRQPPHTRSGGDSAESDRSASGSEPQMVIQDDLTSSHTFTSSFTTQVYVLKGDAADPTHIQYQGTAKGVPGGSTLGQLRLLGVDNSDFVRVWMQHYDLSGSASMPRVFPAAASEDGAANNLPVSTAKAEKDLYKLETDIELQNGRAQTMTVYYENQTSFLSTPPEVQLCSQDLNVGCLGRVTMSNYSGSPSLWQAKVVATDLGIDQLPTFSIVRVTFDPSESQYPHEVIRWVQLAGSVGPAYVNGFAPLADGQVMVLSDNPQPDVPDCNFVSYMPATNSTLFLAPFFSGMIGQPLDITMRMTDPQTQTCMPPPPCQNQFFPNPVTVVMGFDPQELIRHNVTPDDLILAQFDPGQSFWMPLQTVDVNEDLSFISAEAYGDGIFGIFYNRPTTTGVGLLHVTDLANILGHRTILDDPALNGIPNIRPIITHNSNPGGGSGDQHDHEIGVEYDAASARWRIFNRDQAAMQPGVDFNVLVPDPAQPFFLHQHIETTPTPETQLDFLPLNFDPDKVFLFTQNSTPDGVENDTPVGAQWNGGAGKWELKNESGNMPDKAAFNVFVPTFDQHSFALKAETGGNIAGDGAAIDHPAADNKPDAMLFVSRRVSAFSSLRADSPAIGVRYDAAMGKWLVFNEDGSAMEDGAEYNVLIMTEAPRAPTNVGLISAETPQPSTQFGLLLILSVSLLVSATLLTRARRSR